MWSAAGKKSAGLTVKMATGLQTIMKEVCAYVYQSEVGLSCNGCMRSQT